MKTLKLLGASVITLLLSSQAMAFSYKTNIVVKNASSDNITVSLDSSSQSLAPGSSKTYSYDTTFYYAKTKTYHRDLKFYKGGTNFQYYDVVNTSKMDLLGTGTASVSFNPKTATGLCMVGMDGSQKTTNLGTSATLTRTFTISNCK